MRAILRCLLRRLFQHGRRRRLGGCSAGRTALVTLVMSYFETSDRLVLSVFVGSTGLIVFFWFLTKSVATAAAEIDRRARALRRGGALFDSDDPRHPWCDRGRRQDQQALRHGHKIVPRRRGGRGRGAGAVAREEEQLVQSTSELRRLYVDARAAR